MVAPGSARSTHLMGVPIVKIEGQQCGDGYGHLGERQDYKRRRGRPRKIGVGVLNPISNDIAQANAPPALVS